MTKLDNERQTINKIDKEMADLFVKRMQASSNIAKIKQEQNMQVFDKEREKEVINSNLGNVPDDIKKYYMEYLTEFMNISKKYQSSLLNNLTVYASDKTYDIIVENGSLNKLNDYLPLDRKVLIITDDKVSKLYLQKVKSQIKNCFVCIIPNGEKNKNIQNYKSIIEYLILHEFTRSDCIIGLGGGVVGDLSGFIASTYMRGIPFYNIPTTLLAQVDSSIGGKTAIDFDNIKNVIGSFYSPNRVIIDPTVLQTLDSKQLHSGLVEAIKMALTSDENLFNLIETSNNIYDDLEAIIKKSIKIKQEIVEQDYKEEGLRRVLNFGHTVGHAIESLSCGKLLHGECVGIGMTYFITDPNLKERLINVLKKYNLPYTTKFKKEDLLSYIIHDKKIINGKLNVVEVNKIGEFVIKEIDVKDIINYL